MRRYIDADAFYARMKECVDKLYSGDEFGCKFGLIDVEILLHQIPTVDAVEHGHWIPVGEYGEYECSVCHWPASRDSHDYHRDTSPYCRFCGAKMEGDENEID